MVKNKDLTPSPEKPLVGKSSLSPLFFVPFFLESCLQLGNRKFEYFAPEQIDSRSYNS